MSAKQLIKIDVVSDIMWPWCWIGKRKLETAMQSMSEKYDFLVRWEPFLLRSNIPPEGIKKPDATPDNPRLFFAMFEILHKPCYKTRSVFDLVDAWSIRHDTTSLVQHFSVVLADRWIKINALIWDKVTCVCCRVSPRLKSAGASVGIDFTGKCDRYPNTLKGHALLEYAKTHNNGALQNDLQEALFKVLAECITISNVFVTITCPFDSKNKRLMH